MIYNIYIITNDSNQMLSLTFFYSNLYVTYYFVNR